MLHKNKQIIQNTVSRLNPVDISHLEILHNQNHDLSIQQTRPNKIEKNFDDDKSNYSANKSSISNKTMVERFSVSPKSPMQGKDFSPSSNLQIAPTQQEMFSNIGTEMNSSSNKGGQTT